MAYSVGYRVVSKHTGLEYEIVEVMDSGSTYRGKRDDGEIVPLSSSGIVPSTLQNAVEVSKEYKYEVGTKVGIAGLEITNRRPQRGTDLLEYEIRGAWFYEGFVDKLAKEVKPEPVAEEKPNKKFRYVNAEDVSQGQVIFYRDKNWRVSGKEEYVDGGIQFTLSSMDGKHYKTTYHCWPKASVALVENPVTLQCIGTGQYRVNGVRRSAVTGRYKTGGYVEQEPVYKYEVGELWTGAVGGHRIEERRLVAGKREYLLSGWFFGDGGIAAPHWRDEDTVESMHRGFKKVDWEGMAKWLSDSLKVVSSVGVSSVIRYEGVDYTVKDAHYRVDKTVTLGIVPKDNERYTYRTIDLEASTMLEVIG